MPIDWRSRSRACSCSRRRSTPEQLVLDGVADELVAEAELVVGLLDEQATIDKGAQVGDQLLFGSVAEDGQHVELRPWSEHRGRLDELALFDRQAVELRG